MVDYRYYGLSDKRKEDEKRMDRTFRFVMFALFTGGFILGVVVTLLVMRYAF